MDISTLGKDPISEENPAGEDVSYVPEFEALQNEIDKLSIVTAGAGEVDWNRVLDLSSYLLAEKSKNLLVAVYMAQALIKTRRLEGMHQGCRVLGDLAENYWDTMFPPKKRKKGRINALRWWYDRTDQFLKNFDGPAVPRETVDGIKETLSALDKVLSEKIEEAPILRPLVQQVERIPVEADHAEKQVEEEKTEAPESREMAAQSAIPLEAEAGGEAVSPPEPRKSNPEKPDQEKPVVAASQQTIKSLESDKDANKALNGALDIMARLSGYYGKSDSSNPLSYRLNRIYAWLAIDALPMIQDGNKTPLPPPDEMIRNGLESQLAGREYENAVLSAETRLREHLFWLDLNRFAARGLESLGGKYARAHDAVCAETAMFVQRLPNIENLAFSDGTPFADSETRAWLKSIISSGGAEDAAAVNVDSEGDPSRYREIEGEAMQLVKEKKVVDAVSLFQENLVRGASGREKLLFRTGLCRMLVGLGRIELAMPHLETLEALIDFHDLESWEPELALQGLRLIYDGYKESSSDTLKEKASAIFDRIARIDPAAAYKLCSK